ncbi:MAG: fumarate hydratase [Candidatus Schekmanbacteria bacterium RIFCSPHIGHO2_02_FULL_38_11]|uniref:Fumarate hydratase n=1 Tax=Candidatus Schekmanbacteria bacterium RIFCSPLOWO2_12_FULL_38_15 TaxID=1817883 RepID=A0A1F7SKY3_9BACT|nr:MAG: fumarate hydratase [Candidatus Schekmanbacteria bacterium GWA2_38_9]OGL48190.1 MAG: fumarate hydratase [Candidatus Schekmanbacteria bacterium RIFCSPLOWO2_02_FULL_38_14]OGL54419.1 MAG: fumarate hydratase [Candidatus Schekmanbacteria bacterium RIFCSPLOWO2_12_FULL_38_15]OGL54636.1 MAG: fumarate hydratase [Candidatus Schekmanbacteria bacterium RIFCSPHIGHO2_02_FULL_38_11]
MGEPIKIITPVKDDKVIEKLKAGDQVLITGTIYTGRDAAHKRLVELLDTGKPLPIDVKGQMIYYVGPTPAKPGKVIGSAGPTTSGRMDAYAPRLIELGLKGMIGKGSRSKDVIEAMKKYKCVYLAAIGGAAALIAQRIKSSKVVAYEELGAEAICLIEVEDFPVVVVNDVYGNDLYEQGRKQYQIG